MASIIIFATYLHLNEPCHIRGILFSSCSAQHKMTAHAMKMINTKVTLITILVGRHCVEALKQ